MADKVKVYHLDPTERIPNSPHALLHYPGVFDPAGPATQAFDSFRENGWQTQWIFRYGNSQASHYHSKSHECMAVLNGQASIRFGVADISPDLEENTYGSSYEAGGVTVHVTAGDVLVIPAGVSHKTYDTVPRGEFKLLTPGDGSGIEADDTRAAVASIEFDGFTMIGAYPTGCEWDFQTDGTADRSTWSAIWGVPRPAKDPCFGESVEGLCGLWQDESSPHLSAFAQ